jgi:hypothetical protein
MPLHRQPFYRSKGALALLTNPKKFESLCPFCVVDFLDSEEAWDLGIADWSRLALGNFGGPLA